MFYNDGVGSEVYEMSRYYIVGRVSESEDLKLKILLDHILAKQPRSSTLASDSFLPCDGEATQ